MKILNKTLSAGVAAMLLLPYTGAAAEAAQENSPKEEVIYVMTSAGGQVQGVYAVDIFDSGEVTDYGDYSSVKLLNTSDDLTVNGDEIDFTASGDKTYLQGTLDNAQIPWDISITYSLDGKSITPNELAGKSGALEIRFKVTKNEKCDERFYKNYALQASFQLDTAIAENITAEDATIANVGKKKQLTYTILPDNGIDTVITADIHDFEMPAAEINGIKLNLDVEVDTSELSDKVEQLQEGISQLNDGSQKLNSGADDLNDGAQQLDGGAAELCKGAAALLDGAKKLDSGADSLTDGIKELHGGALQLAEGTETLSGGAKELSDGAEEVDGGAKSLESGAKELSGGAGTLSDGADALKTGGKELTDGTQQLSDGAAQLDSGIADLKSGMEQIESGLDALDSKSADLRDGSSQVLDALTVIKTSLGSVSADTAQLELLVKSSGEIMSGISTIRSAVEQLESGVGYEQYKAILAGKGLDIDTLKEGNAQAIAQLTDQITQLEATLSQIKDIPGYEQQAAELSAQIEQFSQLVKLLSGSNAAMDGTQQYLDGISANIGELKEGVCRLESQYAQFDAAIGELAGQLSGILVDLGTLSQGVNTLVDEYENLDSGIEEYTDGVARIVAGYSTLTSGAKTLGEGGKSLLSGADRVNSGANELYDGIISLADGADTLSDGADSLYGGAAELAQGTGKLSAGAKELSDGAQEVDKGADDLADGADTLYSGAKELSDGIAALYDGAQELSDGTKELSDGSKELSDGMQDLCDGTSELSDGTNELYDKTSDMDEQVSEKIDSVLDSLQGGDDVISFVSEKNTNVESVQFVIKTEAIELPEQEVQEEKEEEKLNFWQKLLRLFGLY